MLNTLLNDISQAGIGLFFVGAFLFLISYGISQWFSWIVFRLLLLLLGSAVIHEIAYSDQSILFNLELYVALGMIAPHLRLLPVMLYRIGYAIEDFYYRFKNFLYFLFTPIRVIYELYLKIYYFYQDKAWDKRQREYEKQEAQRREQERTQYEYQEYQRREQDRAEYERQEYARREKDRKDYEESQRQQQNSSNGSNHQNNSHQYNNDQKKQKRENKSHYNDDGYDSARWDSNDPYVILDLQRGASKAQIKKQRNKLAMKYHPDIAPAHKKDLYNKIMQRINWAYDQLNQ
jgi:hypothetical protein